MTPIAMVLHKVFLTVLTRIRINFPSTTHTGSTWEGPSAPSLDKLGTSSKNLFTDWLISGKIWNGFLPLSLVCILVRISVFSTCVFLILSPPCVWSLPVLPLTLRTTGNFLSSLLRAGGQEEEPIFALLTLSTTVVSWLVVM